MIFSNPAQCPAQRARALLSPGWRCIPSDCRCPGTCVPWRAQERLPLCVAVCFLHPETNDNTYNYTTNDSHSHLVPLIAESTLYSCTPLNISLDLRLTMFYRNVMPLNNTAVNYIMMQWHKEKIGKICKLFDYANVIHDLVRMKDLCYDTFHDTMQSLNVLAQIGPIN